MRVQNPNDRSLPVKGLSYVVDVAGKEFAHGDSAASFIVPALGEAEFDMNVTANMAGALFRFLGSKESEGRSGGIQAQGQGRAVGGLSALHSVRGDRNFQIPLKSACFLRQQFFVQLDGISCPACFQEKSCRMPLRIIWRQCVCVAIEVERASAPASNASGAKASKTMPVPRLSHGRTAAPSPQVRRCCAPAAPCHSADCRADSDRTAHKATASGRDRSQLRSSEPARRCSRGENARGREVALQPREEIFIALIAAAERGECNVMGGQQLEAACRTAGPYLFVRPSGSRHLAAVHGHRWSVSAGRGTRL